MKSLLKISLLFLFLICYTNEAQADPRKAPSISGFRAKKDESKSTLELKEKKRPAATSSSSMTDDERAQAIVELIEKEFQNDEPIDMDKLRGLINKMKKDKLLRGADMSGYVAKEKTQESRSFENEREREILKQLGTQFFYAATEKARQIQAKAPVEIQLMYAGDKVFIASNDNANLQRLEEILKNPFGKNPLSTDYSSLITEKGEKGEKKRDLLLRFYQKLKLLESSEEFASSRNREVAKTILDLFSGISRNHDLVDHLDISENDFQDPFREGNPARIIFVSEPDSWGRHAEMKFVDMLRNLSQRDENICRREFFIAGKKRPCTACSVELEHLMANQGFDHLVFGSNQGKIWLRPLLRAMQNIEDRNQLVEILKEKLPIAYVSDAGADVDSQSSAIDEEYKEQLKERKEKEVAKKRSKEPEEGDERPKKKDRKE